MVQYFFQWLRYRYHHRHLLVVWVSLAIFSPLALGNLLSAQDTAELIRTTYETRLDELPMFKRGHYGLRLYRQTRDPKYIPAIEDDLSRISTRLNLFANTIDTNEEIAEYSLKRLLGYLDDYDERSRRRYHATQWNPEYLYLGVDLLGAMARANEYGLKHEQDVKLRQILKRYDFSLFVTDQEMIKAWAAQLANQVYWLKQLGEEDYTDLFIQRFKEVYPDTQDHTLTKQQLMNKIYGMTHIILADSEYYQKSIESEKYPWIFDYFRNNIEQILTTTKEDVIAEVGVCFLLAGLVNDPVVTKTREAIRAAVDLQQGMIPSTTGSFEFVYGEHRNVLAIMLLDWQEPQQGPTAEHDSNVFINLPDGLIPK
ncbi:DUF3541 domain-containing protein [Vibrio sp. FNV 38]|nr:DUF3541 domain-containing protein [Vibrio sp. FNV 38]